MNKIYENRYNHNEQILQMDRNNLDLKEKTFFVYENEPKIDPRLKKLNNVVLLPHIGSATIEGRVAMGEKVIINIKTVADGHTPPDLVLETLI